MKLVEAIIKPEMLDGVLDGLAEIGYPGVTISDVRGHGRQKGVTHRWRGNAYTVQFIPKVKIEVAIQDDDLHATMEMISNKARTGKIGDGKVFVMDVAEVLRVRTGDTGSKAI